MRPIKFRVWIPEDQRMIYPKPFVAGTPIEKDDLFMRLDGVICWCSSAGRIDRITNDCQVMQFTGLLDKTGKEIYEGDILEEHPGGDRGAVFFDERYGGYSISTPGNWPQAGKWDVYMEVIGNIYEHPELLK